MTDGKPVFLVIMPVDVGPVPGALRYAAARAKEAKGSVALLAVVQTEEIGPWSGVEKVMTDDAFDRARKVMACYAAFAEKESGAEPVTIFRKGSRREVLGEVLEKEPGVIALVLNGATDGEGGNDLIQYLTSDKGMKRLCIPLIVVPDTFYPEEKEKKDVHSD